jgi:hypothetical protein
MNPLVGFFITGVLPLVGVVATIGWFIRYARRHGSDAHPLGVRDVPTGFWLVVLVEVVGLVALILWAYPQLP